MSDMEGIVNLDRSENGAVCRTAEGLLSVTFVTNGTVRVRYTREDSFSESDTGVCLSMPPFEGGISAQESDDTVTLKGRDIHVCIARNSSSLVFLTPEGKPLLTENASDPRVAEPVDVHDVVVDLEAAEVVETADGERVVGGVTRSGEAKRYWRMRHNLAFADGEGIYGLGGHEENVLNLRGTMQYCYEHNMKEFVPVLVSSHGYGILYDAGCAMIFHDGVEGAYMQLETVKDLDYYFLNGPTLDDVVANYRILTGAAPMLPRWAFGYCQSKERYKTQEELVSVVKEYRERGLPLDLIIQDWQYWPGDAWGSMLWDEERFPDPEKMCRDIHEMNAHVMVSIWPHIRNCPLAEEMKAEGQMLNTGQTYDALSDKGRSIYWEAARKGIFEHGFDAWWCDCTEPAEADWANKEIEQSMTEKRFIINTSALGNLLGAPRVNLFSLNHSRGMYENQRKTTDEKRVVNLTRSVYAGQQRYSTVVWSGDIAAGWEVLASQVAQGQNFCATGVPYWTNDIGAFFVRDGAEWFWAGSYEKGCEDMGYRELYARWFQYGAFLPMFRSHGTDTPREVWRFGKPGEMFYDSIEKFLKLRYRLLPYIYSLAGMVTQEHYTMMRPLAFDFPHDPDALDVKDQYMFGPAFMVCPVTRPMYYEADSKELNVIDKARPVYLPAGRNWYDFWTGKKHEGGRAMVAECPIDIMPLYVPEGSIIPMGPDIQHTGEKLDAPWDVHVYPGRNCLFTMYEDSGDGYGYEKGEFCTWHMVWDDSRQGFHTSIRKGSFPGMVKKRELNVHVQGRESDRELAGL